MIRVAVEVREHTVVRRVRITAGSIERALSMAGKGNPEREVNIVFPIEAERFFAGKKEADGSVGVLPTRDQERSVRVAA